MIQLNDRFTAITKHYDRSIVRIGDRLNEIERLEQTIRDLLCQIQK